jgi:hypothetical protein
MGEWFLSRRDRLIVVRHEVPLQFCSWTFGDLERGTRVIYAPKVATRLSPGFQPGNPQNKRVRPEGARG